MSAPAAKPQVRPAGAPTAGSSAAGYDLERDWPWIPVDRDAVRVLNPRANIAVVLGQLKAGDSADASPADVLARLPAGFPLEYVAAVGRVRTLKEGVERLVRNVIANPFIDTLLLLGKDSKVFRPLRGIDCLLRHGVDADGHILGPDQDENVLRIFRRDSLVNLTPADVAYFRDKARVRVIAELIDGPATAEEAWAAALPSVRSHAGGSRAPGWGFLEDLAIKEWKPPEAEPAQKGWQVDPGLRPALVGLSGSERPEAEKRNRTTTLTWSANGRTGAKFLTHTSTANNSEKALHTWLRFRRNEAQVDVVAACEAAIAFEDDLAKAVADPSALELRSTPGAGDAVVAMLTAFADDPKGHFLVSVDHERKRLSVDVYQNKRIAEPSTARLVATIVGTDIRAILKLLLDRDYFGHHDLRLEHIGYIAIMLRRAEEALRTGRRFVQDQPLGPRITPPNRDGTADARLNAAVLIDAPTLEAAWKQGLASLINDGLETRTQKGPVRENWCTLFHIHDMAAWTIPAGYPAGEENIRRYAEEFFAERPAGAEDEYTYGDRMCHFYYDQVENLIRRLKARPDLAHPGQRYDPWNDLGRPHIPCLAFDVWFLHGGRLHTLQITRSHDIYGAMPQNALGIARGWAARIASALGVPAGDLVFLSTSNNFRAADNAAAAAEVVKSVGAVEEKSETALVRVKRVGSGQSAAGGTRSFADCRPPTADRRPIDVLYLPNPPAAAELDAEPARATLAGQTAIGRRLLRHRGTDQIARFADHLNAELGKNPGYRTQYGVLSPRDPFEDRDAEQVELLSLQLRNQLGRLHAAAVFVNPTGDDRAMLSITAAVQGEAARRVNLPPGSVFLLKVKV